MCVTCDYNTIGWIPLGTCVAWHTPSLRKKASLISIVTFRIPRGISIIHLLTPTPRSRLQGIEQRRFSSSQPIALRFTSVVASINPVTLLPPISIKLGLWPNKNQTVTIRRPQLCVLLLLPWQQWSGRPATGTFVCEGHATYVVSQDGRLAVWLLTSATVVSSSSMMRLRFWHKAKTASKGKWLHQLSDDVSLLLKNLDAHLVLDLLVSVPLSSERKTPQTELRTRGGLLFLIRRRVIAEPN